MTNKSDRPALVIPSGVHITSDEEGFTLGNRGDVVIHGNPGIKLKVLFSTNGSVRLHADTPLSLHRIEASNGGVYLSGSLEVQSIRARRLVLESGSLSAGALVADESISLNGEVLQADFVVGPLVEIDDRLKGRATVIETSKELGPHRLKGAFRLEEFLELFPTGEQMLRRYPDVETYLQKSGESVAALSEEDDDSEVDGAVEGSAAAGEREGDVLTLTNVVPASSGKSSGADDDVEELTEPQDSDDALYKKLSECYLKIMGFYSDLPLPPPIGQLETLIEERKYQDLKKKIASIWNDLIEYHKREGLDIANAVMNNVKTIKQVLQERA